MTGLDVEIHPEPEPDEAAALIAAIQRAVDEDGVLDPPAGLRSAWLAAGRAEATA